MIWRKPKSVQIHAGPFRIRPMKLSWVRPFFLSFGPREGQLLPPATKSLSGDCLLFDLTPKRGSIVAGTWIEPLIYSVPPRVGASSNLPNVGLHRKFANTAGLQEQILEFARRYGYLGHRCAFLSETGATNGPVVVERLHDWLGQIYKVRQLIRLWDELNDDETAAERLFFSWLRPRSFYDSMRPQLNVACDEARANGIRIPSFENLRYGGSLDDPLGTVTPTRFAWQFLTDQINQMLAETTVPACSLSGAKRRAVLAPLSLLGAIYVTFADETIGGQWTVARCQGCGEYFTPKTNHQKYCRDPVTGMTKKSCENKYFNLGTRRRGSKQ